MLLGKSSDGYSIILAEFEKADVPYCRTTDNMESESIRKELHKLKIGKDGWDNVGIIS